MKHFYHKEDIEHWLPKVKNNGIISGHDINSNDVKRAVLEKLDDPKHVPEWDIWFYKVKK